ncbi:MAG: tRNA pseudouridine(55) synthase TruB [Geothrix sp.]|uniref:tRNA pseudouridine(55) synthase TruB n=1 Tax=Geothrix sp. TaxID=1962974 RepID=UPI00184E4626|nr:tRNA pseudouridine(55) synthase TruB [Geothrix sp.]NWJ42439.1 tRNA pseudouridine(55) synthase TruB [Geothrix sp.]WIL19597.1 MAG: tRNA pseudouridine(55) synthase TruB [Geothrix sp.]
MIEAGIHLVHKTVGQSSFDVIRGFKRRAFEAGQKKLALGHGGTLDPFADGLLLVLAGQATRLMELMHPLPKTYVAEVAWGVETDTCDLQGLPLSEGDASQLTPAALDAALTPFLGWTEQVPPATSAKKIDGEAAYKKAHRGEVVLMKPSRVFLLSARWIRHDLPRRSTLEITCRGGFYVRSLARDLGRSLGCGAHLAALRRTAIGPWGDPGLDQERLLTGVDLLPWCPSRLLSDEEADHLSHGRAVPVGESQPASWALPEGFPDPGAPLRALHGGRLVALLKPAGEGLRTFANLRGGL